MRTTKTSIHSLILAMLLSACGARTASSTLVPEVPTATPPALPAPTSTVTLPAPQPGAFPYAPVLNEALPKDRLVLAAHIFADNTCYDVGVYEDNSYIVLSCLSGFTYPAPTGILDLNQSSHVLHWIERYQSYEKPSVHGLLKFLGSGTQIADNAAGISMERLLFDLEWDAHEYASGGGYPNAVYVVQLVLAEELGVGQDDITLLKFEVVDFPDACLGVPGPDELCAQVITPGLIVQLIADNMLYEYHTEFFGYDIRQFGEPRIAPTPAAGG